MVPFIENDNGVERNNLCLQTGRSHVALLVQPLLPQHSEEHGTNGDEVHLTVRADSGSDAANGDVVASHSDPHDPWHQVTHCLQLCCCHLSKP